MFALPAAGLSAAELVEVLADPHRSFGAYQCLIAMGQEACEAARAGLHHPSPRVRQHCCMLLDHVMDEQSVPALLGVLADPDAEVRRQALHALACDRCKQGSCRPTASAVLPAAVTVLKADPSPHVRAMAVEVAGAWVHTHPGAAAALAEAAASDPSPAVRKKAAWYAPGGTVYRRTAPAVSR
jgi:HEAT repeat protein